MDPELKALIDKYHAAGATDDEILKVAAAWKAQRSSGGIQDISPQLQQQADARQAQINAAGKPSIGRDMLALARAFPGTSAILGPPTKSDMPILARQAVTFGAGAVPGSTAAGSYVASKLSGRPYGDVVRDVNAQMSDMPGIEEYGLNMLGGLGTGELAGKAAESIPAIRGVANPVVRSAATGAVAGGGLAAAYRAGQPNPEPIAARVRGAVGSGVAGGALGGAIGAVAPMFAARRLAAKVPTADVAASDAAAEAKAADQQNFGQVHAEAAAAGGTSPAVRAALADADLAPYVRDVESMPATRNLSDAEKLLAARNLMTERQGQIIGPMDARHPGAGSRYENQSLGIMKGRLDRSLTAPSVHFDPAITETFPGTETAQSPPPDLRTAIGNFWDRQAAAAARKEGTVAQQMAREALERHSTENILSPPLRGAPLGPREVEVAPQTREVLPPVAPSLPEAEATSAQNARNRDASDVVRKIARRAMTGKTPVKPSALVAQGDFNTGRMYQQFDPGQRQAAQQAILSQLKGTPAFYKAPFVRVPLAPSRATRVAPSLLEKMGDTRPSAMAEVIRNMLLAGSVPQFGSPTP